ncbi:carboxymuconolactone decarboxylase family protein [Rhodococcus koreensis]|uniref:carboxymuconolactone decarboxylase family protein n=1 Tax=Rhodococcus koreensis TaxID=99653 RepID=UPI00366ECCC5
MPVPHNHRHAPLGADLAPEMGSALAAFNAAVFTGPGEIPRKYRELIGIAVALTTQCEACIRFHTEDAMTLGTSEQELAEVTYIAAAMRAGGAVVHGMKALSVAARASKPMASTGA